MTFKDLAWAAFLYRGWGYDKDYQSLMLQRDVLTMLRTDPQQLPPKKFTEIVVLFLNQWRCRISDTIGRRLLRFTRTNLNRLQEMEGGTLLSATAEKLARAGQLYGQLRQWDGVGPAIAGKFLHVFNPEIFLPIDNPMLEAFRKKGIQEIVDSSEGYAAFLALGQSHARQAEADYRALVRDMKLEEFLSAKLEYETSKSLVKFLDEYFWVTMTNEFEIPPRWSPADI